MAFGCSRSARRQTDSQRVLRREWLVSTADAIRSSPRTCWGIRSTGNRISEWNEKRGTKSRSTKRGILRKEAPNGDAEAKIHLAKIFMLLDLILSTAIGCITVAPGAQQAPSRSGASDCINYFVTS